MDSDRCTYWESWLDSLDDSTPVSIFPYIGKMAGSEEASVSRMSGFFHDIERVLLEFVRFAGPADLDS